MDERVLVNQAAWDGPELPGGWQIVNAPRPLLGEKTWTGPFRHGVFYAAGPAPGHLPEGSFDRSIAEGRVRSWKSDDAWPVVFTDNAEIAGQVQAKLDEYQTTLEELDMTAGELALSMNLPWHEEAGQ